jgi:septum formation protein
MNVILASGSPRRFEILSDHGITPIVIKPDVEETLPETLDGLGVDLKVMFLALQKGLAVYERLKTADDLPRYIIAADTIVYKDRIIGKPVDEEDAFAILASLRNASNFVYSGVVVIDRQTDSKTILCDVTEVVFKDYPDEEIFRYIREERPFDKSGAYAIQSSWSGNVDHWNGDVENVMGLPWLRIEPLIATETSRF